MAQVTPVCYPQGLIDWNDIDGAEPDEQGEGERLLAEQFAWQALESLTAYNITLCPVTVRPCISSERHGRYLVEPFRVSDSSYSPFYPHVQNGVWTNIWCGGECEVVESVKLPGQVGYIVEVRVDGQLIPASAYRVDNGNELVRQDGGSWPVRQDMDAPAGAPGTFTITYHHGVATASTTVWAAKKLADEYLAAIQGRECALPSGVTTLSRQGISYEVTRSMFEDGYTGINEVDLVIEKYNPYRTKGNAGVYSIDSRAMRRRTS